MLYRRTITEEYTYESEQERNKHVAEMVKEGYVDSGQVKQRMKAPTLLAGSPYPIWDNQPDDYVWYSKLTKVEEPGVSVHENPSETRTEMFGMSDAERKLRRLHEMALVGVGDSKEGRAMVNECYLTLLELVAK